MAVSQEYDLGNPINSTIVAQDQNFNWNDYDNVVVYLIGKVSKLKLSVIAKEGYLPLTIQDAQTLLIEVPGKTAKTLGKGDVKLNIWVDSENVQQEIVKSTLFGINYIDNEIKSEIV